ncbi:MAG: SDR family NAD(P)-dependent oxidoreductase, partial [Salinigranum sp.]
LDALVNNAGTWQGERHLVDLPGCDAGVEFSFAVNHLAPYLLTRRLLPRLLESEPARVVTVSSDLHRRASLDLTAVVGADGPAGRTAYALSKLANVLFAYELARRLDGTGVTANCVHPGVITSTDLSRNASGLSRLGFRLVGLVPGVGTDARGGARTSVWAASSPEVEGVSGRYFVDEEARRSSDATYDREAQRRLWAWSAKAVGLPAELEVDAGGA